MAASRLVHIKLQKKNTLKVNKGAAKIFWKIRMRIWKVWPCKLSKTLDNLYIKLCRCSPLVNECSTRMFSVKQNTLPRRLWHWSTRYISVISQEQTLQLLSDSDLLEDQSWKLMHKSTSSKIFWESDVINIYPNAFKS